MISKVIWFEGKHFFFLFIKTNFLLLFLKEVHVMTLLVLNVLIFFGKNFEIFFIFLYFGDWDYVFDIFPPVFGQHLLFIFFVNILLKFNTYIQIFHTFYQFRSTALLKIRKHYPNYLKIKILIKYNNNNNIIWILHDKRRKAIFIIKRVTEVISLKDVLIGESEV